jgi:hypothetical protein
MSQKYLWSFYWDCGRSGSLEGLFVATEKEIEEATGQGGDTIHYDEVSYSDGYDSVLDEKYNKVCAPCYEALGGDVE